MGTGISRRQSVKSIGNKTIKSGKSAKSVKSGKSGTTKVDVLKVGDTSTHKAVDRVSKRNSQTEEDRLLQLEEELLKIGEEKVSHWMETTSQGVNEEYRSHYFKEGESKLQYASSKSSKSNSTDKKNIKRVSKKADEISLLENLL